MSNLLLMFTCIIKVNYNSKAIICPILLSPNILANAYCKLYISLISYAYVIKFFQQYYRCYYVYLYILNNSLILFFLTKTELTLLVTDIKTSINQGEYSAQRNIRAAKFPAAKLPRTGACIQWGGV